MGDTIARNPKPNKNYCLSFFEALACIFIIFIHIGFPGNFGITMQSLARFGVPLFFAISGFYLYKDGITNEEIRAKIKKRAPHILYLLIFSFCIYLLLYTLLAEFGKDGEGGLQYLANSFTWKKLGYFLIFSKPFVNGKNWFLIAMLYSYLFIFLFPSLFTKNKWFVYVLSGLTVFWYFFRITAILTNPVLFGEDLTTPFMYLSWFNNGLLFMSLGIVIRRNEKWFGSLSTKFILIALFSSLALMVGEMFFMKKVLLRNTSFCVGNITCVISMMALSIKKPMWFSNLKILQINGKWTTYVYIFHSMIITFTKLIFAEIKMNGLAKRWIMPIIVVIVSVTISILFSLLMEKIKKSIENHKNQKVAA